MTLKHEWKGQVATQKSNQKQFVRKEQDELVFTNKETKEAVIQRKLKEKKNLEYNKGVGEMVQKNKLDFLKTEDLDFGKSENIRLKALSRKINP